MNKQLALQIISIFALAGILFSGYLSYRELFLGGCNPSFISCGTRTVNIIGLPACVYGFVMYTIVFVISLLGLKSKN